MTSEVTSQPGAASGPVLLCYDGSPLAELAISEAGRQLAPGRAALVVCVWQPADVGFSPVEGHHLDAANALQVEQAAQKTAAHGAALATAAGFHAGHLAIEKAPTWRGIIEVASDHEAAMIVIGSHRHGGLIGHLVGSVAAAVVAHASCPVLVVRQSH